MVPVRIRLVFKDSTRSSKSLRALSASVSTLGRSSMDTTGDAGLAAARLRGFFSGDSTPSDASPGGSAAVVSDSLFLALGFLVRRAGGLSSGFFSSKSESVWDTGASGAVNSSDPAGNSPGSSVPDPVWDTGASGVLRAASSIGIPSGFADSESVWQMSMRSASPGAPSALSTLSGSGSVSV